MCGIFCAVDPHKQLSLAEANAMTDAVAHRGPDGRGLALFATDLATSAGDDFLVALGHRRLSILDLSEAGAQPMSSPDGGLTLVYNGEIYNYLELRAELEKLGHAFRSHCDTEVLLAAYRQWGEDCPRRFNGMWAFALLDHERRRLFISRDRIGVKPLYHCRHRGGLFIFSEIKQMLALPDFRRAANPAACVRYLATGHEAPDESFFADIAPFPPGHMAVIELDSPVVSPRPFWFPESIVPRRVDSREIVPEIRRRFARAVELRLRSDVPVGGCLSGGLDSSAIFVEMRRQAPSTTFSAFSACFGGDPGIDETPFMEDIVREVRGEHVKVFPEDSGFAANFDQFLRVHDEPVGSASIFAQYLVMAAARERRVPVLLDGQGGDELFSGYWSACFITLNHLLAQGKYWRLGSHTLGAALPGGNQHLLGNAWNHFAGYRRRSGHHLPFAVRPEHADLLPDWHRRATRLSPAEYRLAEIRRVHLPRLLKWEDRNSMAYSIESRVPFLDVNLVELLLGVEPEANLHRGWNKYLFRQASAELLPERIRWRKDKKGFETPQRRWMAAGPFHQTLLRWCANTGHPAAEFADTNYASIAKSLTNGDFDEHAVFRLFCLDRWMEGF